MSGPIIDEDFGGPGSDEERVLEYLEAFFAGDMRQANELLDELRVTPGGARTLGSFASALVAMLAEEHRTTPAEVLAIVRGFAVDGVES